MAERSRPLTATESGTLLEVTDLITHFRTPRGIVRAVDGVSFSLERGRALGIVGESGSGKTVLSRSIMGLLAGKSLVRDGSVLFEGQELIGTLDAKQMRAHLGPGDGDDLPGPDDVAQPGDEDRRPDRRAAAGPPRRCPRRRRATTAERLLRDVRIPEAGRRLDQYPHEMSGGMRQRVMIAIALACGPTLLFADEPTTALDVTVQSQILDLIGEQRQERNMSVVLVTHDLGVVAGHTDEIAVMYGGRIVEKAPTKTLFADMRMPYTEALMESIPQARGPAPHPAGDDPRPAARPRQPAGRVQVRAALRVRARPLPRRGAAAGGGRRPGPPVRLLVPRRLPGVPLPTCRARVASR